MVRVARLVPAKAIVVDIGAEDRLPALPSVVAGR